MGCWIGLWHLAMARARHARRTQHVNRNQQARLSNGATLSRREAEQKFGTLYRLPLLWSPDRQRPHFSYTLDHIMHGMQVKMKGSRNMEPSTSITAAAP